MTYFVAGAACLRGPCRTPMLRGKDRRHPMPDSCIALTQWHPDKPHAHPLPDIWRPWLLHQGSLTERLRQHWPADFAVELLHQGWGRPCSSERSLLALPFRRWALIREVLLHGGGRPRVFARSIIPAATLKQADPRLGRLGSRALGELLFREAALKRSAFEFTTVPGQLFHTQLGDRYAETLLWGRRSCFYLGAHPLLVQEFFLP